MGRFLLSIASLLCAAGSVIAAETDTPWMSEDQLRTTFDGQTIDGHYQSGGTFTETYGSGGRVDYRDTLRATGGHWSITNGTFCTIYDDDPTGGCFRVIKSGTNCFEFYFVARTEDEARQPGRPDWTARGWLSGSASTCTDGANV